MNFAVIVFPGSNCDHDAYHVINNVLGISVDFVWHKKNDLSGYDGVIIPGGFSYGDYLRTGAIACFSPIMESIIKEAKSGKPIFGICNGFQILIESGLLPGALIVNKNVRFLSQDVVLEVSTNKSIYTKLMKKNEKLTMPIAHKQGNYIVDESTHKLLKEEDRIIFRYVEGEKGNPNGSMDRIAGVTNQNGNVLGMMPHPERASESILGSQDGLKIFQSLLESI
ncbi:MAG: phosphoribosylformylglycinamidine synthase subunit PurQ [Candidatus Neomarinimicrobiota bacterium]|nr:phosphoribosylformylglycinamidine synthase subunit PurQ [Candidatus Neomarinimicrobiota bacterium]